MLFPSRHCQFPIPTAAGNGDAAPATAPPSSQSSDLLESARRLRRDLISAERQHLITLRDRDLIRDEVLHNIERDLDLEEARFS